MNEHIIDAENENTDSDGAASADTGSLGRAEPMMISYCFMRVGFQT